MRELIVVDDPDTMKLLFSGKYDNIFELIDYHEMAISDIAQRSSRSIPVPPITT